jgi:nucleoside-diphosphate-sugar epimerase
MTERVVTITGGSGFVGQLLRVGLTQHGYRVRVFDRLRGSVVDLLRHRYLGTRQSWPGREVARRVRRIQSRLERSMIRTGLLRPSGDDILDLRSRLSARFRGSYAIVHLAAIAHPRMPGVTEADFRRINYAGAVNVFEAARDAGVPKFVFASSAQVYGINKPVRIDQLPILESNYCPTLEDGQSIYGWLKLEFERYLSRAQADGGTQRIALRLEYPGLRSETAANFYISTSIENLVAGFAGALEATADFGFEAINLADCDVDPRVADMQEFIRSQWPGVPNHTTGNECLLSTAKARALLGYRPLRGGHYLDMAMAAQW